ncbi:HepT-like ribonuclease domain-containing protein [Aromatoleum buckelii]
MAAFRDKLIHDYFEVDLDLVWNTATREIPAMIPLLEKLGNLPIKDV